MKPLYEWLIHCRGYDDLFADALCEWYYNGGVYYAAKGAIRRGKVLHDLKAWEKLAKQAAKRP